MLKKRKIAWLIGGILAFVAWSVIWTWVQFNKPLSQTQTEQAKAAQESLGLQILGPEASSGLGHPETSTTSPNNDDRKRSSFPH